jgi:hypothetical protein
VVSVESIFPFIKRRRPYIRVKIYGSFMRELPNEGYLLRESHVVNVSRGVRLLSKTKIRREDFKKRKWHVKIGDGERREPRVDRGGGPRR